MVTWSVLRGDLELATVKNRRIIIGDDIYPRIFLVNGQGKIIGVSTYVYQKDCQVTNRMVSTSRPFVEKPVYEGKPVMCEKRRACDSSGKWYCLGFCLNISTEKLDLHFASFSLTMKFLICVHVLQTQHFIEQHTPNSDLGISNLKLLRWGQCH